MTDENSIIPFEFDGVDNLSTPLERNQHEFGFLAECDGMCGV